MRKGLCSLLVLGSAMAAAQLCALPAGAASSAPVYTWGQGISDSPTQVTGLPADIVDVQAANWGGIAIDSSGNVWQWNASKEPSASEVVGPTDVVSIGEGNGAPNPWGAAVTSSGVLWTWGYDGKGQLCNGKHTNNDLAPAPVSGLSGVTEVSGGQEHLTILAGGSVWSCGTNDDGQLGNGTTTNSYVPVKVSSISNVTAISAGNVYSIALESSGEVWSWGENNLGQLGNGQTEPYSDLPVEVLLPSGANEINAGGGTSKDGQSLALLANGQVWAWGSDSYGQLGNGKTSTSPSYTPIESTVLQGTNWSYVATGGTTSYGLDSTGKLWAWGNGKSGALGNGQSSGDALTPVLVMSGSTQISAVANTAVALG
jgi:alpha-tubulin suppressor-like RCC1 family protein